MNVQILAVHGQGDYQTEYVTLRVLDDCDLGKYQLCDSTYTAENTVSNRLRHVYWFPDKQVVKGDLIALWTKPGKETTGKTRDGHTIHHFYWDLKTAVWNNDGDAAVLQRLANWSLFPVKR